MANAEHLEILKSGVEKWNEWRKDNKYIKPDLRGANLPNADLRGADLRDADLRYGAKTTPILGNADLSGVHLSGTDLTSPIIIAPSQFAKYTSYLPGVNLSEANLDGANLSEADLSDAILLNARMYGTNLSYSNLSGTDLNGANLEEANLFSVHLIKANLSHANLSRVNLSRADMAGANLTGTIIGHTVFGQTDLSTCIGLESVEVSGSCVIDLPTLRASKNLPKEFLTKLGMPDLLMEYLPDFYNPALMIYPAFLSHSWGDKEFVRKLYEALTKKGVTVWLDEKKMKPGDNIHDSISEGIKYYDKLILVCSENSLNSWWVEKELEKVYEKEREMQKERGKKFRLVIPIRIDDSVLHWKDGILTTVRNSMIGDFTKWQDDSEFEKAVKELVDALNANRPDVKPKSLL